MGHTMFLQNFSHITGYRKKSNIVYKITAITGIKTVRHFDTLNFCQGVK